MYKEIRARKTRTGWSDGRENASERNSLTEPVHSSNGLGVALCKHRVNGGAMEGKRESKQTIEITHTLRPYQPLLNGVSNFTLASQGSEQSCFFATEVSNWVEQNHCTYIYIYPSWRSAKRY